MSDIALDQVVALAFKLSIAEQAKLLERVAAHLAREVETPQPMGLAASLDGRTFEIWSPQIEEGGAAILNQALADHQKQKRARNAE